MEPRELLDTAHTAAEGAHVPYSDYPVGAALQTAAGPVVTGCNVEIANYSNTLHAEEIAVGTAIRDGFTDFEALAVASAARDGVTPCGMCRQTLVEFCDQDLPIHTDAAGEVVTHRLGDILPAAISEEDL
jgi:cytidine deaminase